MFLSHSAHPVVSNRHPCITCTAPGTPPAALGLLCVVALICCWLGIRYIRRSMPYESRTFRKNIRLLSAKIANSRNFSGIWRSYASSLPRISYIVHLRLFGPLLGTLANLLDPCRQEEFTSSPFTTCYLKLFKYHSKKAVRTIQVNIRS